MSSYTPRYQQPVSVQQLTELAPEYLGDEVRRLLNSVNHLARSNNEITEALHELELDEGEPDEEDKKVFQDSINENNETIARQRERLHMIKLALQQKLGQEIGSAMYQDNTMRAGVPPPAPIAARAAPTGGPSMGMDDDEPEDRGTAQANGAAPSRQLNGTAELDEEGGMYL